ncbi:MAG TPA: hypothetical protein VHR72_08985 [Gemmataceae bacterium]|jgi:hypothetical protein|nr:hypothetical protein [Gemmataceae bacterium]
MSRALVLSIACGLALTPPALFAQSGLAEGQASSAAFAPESRRVIKMTVSPAPKSAAPMPHPLWPHLRELKPANGAIFYERSQSLEWWGATFRKQVDTLNLSLDRPWNAKTDSPEWLDNFGALKEIDYAARCENCDWQLTDRLRSEGVWMLIPDMQSMRTLNAINAARIRAAIHQHDFDKAARGLQTSFVMAKNVGEAPTLITNLVGTALAAVAQERIEEWIAEPDAPSLFWSLTDMPNPLINWRRPLQGEAIMFDSMVPEIRQALREAKPRPISPDVLRERLKKFAEIGQLRFDLIEWSLVFAQAAGPARAHFLHKGLAAEDIDRLPVTQLVLMFLMSQHDEQLESYMRLQNLPYWQARPFLNKLHAEQVARSKEASAYRLLDMWLPAFENFFRSRPRLERRFALQRHIEALRLYAAEHDGVWPDALDDLRPLPLPVDPYTGKAFTYRREGDRAILEADAPPGQTPNESNAVRYELTLRKKTSN